MLNLDVTAELRIASENAKAKRAEADRVAAVYAEAESELQKLHEAHTETQRLLGASEASAALDSKHAGAAAAGRKAYLTARDTLEFAEARAEALKPILQAAQDEAEACQKRLDTAFREWSEARRAEYEAEYTEVLRRLIEVVDVGQGFASAASQPQLYHQLSLFQPMNISLDRDTRLSLNRTKVDWKNRESATGLLRRILELRKTLGVSGNHGIGF